MLRLGMFYDIVKSFLNYAENNKLFFRIHIYRIARDNAINTEQTRLAYALHFIVDGTAAQVKGGSDFSLQACNVAGCSSKVTVTPAGQTSVIFTGLGRVLIDPASPDDERGKGDDGQNAEHRGAWSQERERRGERQ